MHPTYDLLAAFISAERDKIRGDEQNNYFGAVFGEITKYYQYLSLTVSRYTPASSLYVASIKKLMRESSLRGDGSWTMTPEEIAEDDARFQQQTALLYELEAFYMFANVLLDRISAATQYYFGLGLTGRQWESFYSMNKHLVGYADAKKLSQPPQELLNTMHWLYNNVSNFRGDFLAHKHTKDRQVRSMMGLVFNNEHGGAYFNVGQMYPKDGETPIIAKKPDELVDYFNTFIKSWVEYLTQNSGQRNLSPPAI